MELQASWGHECQQSDCSQNEKLNLLPVLLTTPRPFENSKKTQKFRKKIKKKNESLALKLKRSLRTLCTVYMRETRLDLCNNCTGK